MNKKDIYRTEVGVVQMFYSKKGEIVGFVQNLILCGLVQVFSLLRHAV